MAEFVSEDLHGSRFERVDLSGASFRDVDLSGSRFRGIAMHGTVISGKKGERIVYIRTLISGKGNESGRAIDTATNTGQYL